MDCLLILYHFSVFLVYFVALVYDLLHIGDPGDEAFIHLFNYKGYGGKFKFLTFICHVSQFCVPVIIITLFVHYQKCMIFSYNLQSNGSDVLIQKYRIGVSVFALVSRSIFFCMKWLKYLLCTNLKQMICLN